MKLRLILIIGALFFLFSPFFGARAANADQVEIQELFMKSEVIEIGKADLGSEERFLTTIVPLKVRILEGDLKNKVVQVDFNINPDVLAEEIPVSIGDRLVIVRTTIDGGVDFHVYEPYRLNALLILALLFIAVVILVAGKQGFSSLIGLAATLLILMKGIIPFIIAGYNPIVVCFLGALLIAGVSLYVAHGFSHRTTLALVSTLLTLLLAFGISILAVSWANLFGMGSDDALSLTFSNLSHVDLRGLLLGAIVIGTLGILDDVTTAQVAAIDEIHRADRRLGFRELYMRGLAVGKEHIAALVNTLLIAYVGASFPVFLLIVDSHRPLWVIVNNEFLAEEIVRTLVGSMTLVVAVPVATLIAAHYYSRLLRA